MENEEDPMWTTDISISWLADYRKKLDIPSMHGLVGKIDKVQYIVYSIRTIMKRMK